ncbi:SpnB-like Rossmann fold domain-containing protein, partial [Actinoalloteichus caeruleus]|uniref:SpnB-like Rossmann fold domain-containing protein n=1 Tax=Actinoalloteichus cyanogriseus TaxID=2893586 RepID=UPI0005BA3F71
VRTAQSENPGRFVLVDLDPDTDIEGVELPELVAGEPQLAVRDGRLVAPRLARVAPEPGEPLPEGGTVL